VEKKKRGAKKSGTKGRRLYIFPCFLAPSCSVPSHTCDSAGRSSDPCSKSLECPSEVVNDREGTPRNSLQVGEAHHRRARREKVVRIHVRRMQAAAVCQHTVMIAEEAVLILEGVGRKVAIRVAVVLYKTRPVPR
jgi:hypothetical protein